MARTLAVRIINATGISDALSELETNLLMHLLPMYARQYDVARAEVGVVRTTTRERFLQYLFYDDVDVIHLISHGTRTSLQVGQDGTVTAKDVRRMAQDNGAQIPSLIFGAACELSSPTWVNTFLDVGAVGYIAPKASVLTRDLAVFETAFYSALFARTGINKSPAQRYFDAYRLARAVQRSVSPSEAAQFYWHSREKTKGRTILKSLQLT